MYVSKILTSDEKILYRGKYHWLFWLMALLTVFIFIGLIAIIVMLCTEMVITNRRMVYKRGWIARKTEEINLTRIEEVNLNQSVFGRILNYGEIKIQGVGEGGMTLPNKITRPLKFKLALQEAQMKLREYK